MSGRLAGALLLWALPACYVGLGDAAEPDPQDEPGSGDDAADDDGADEPQDAPGRGEPESSECDERAPDHLRRLTRTQYLATVEALTEVAVPDGLADQLFVVEAPHGAFANAADGLLVRQSDADAYQRIAETVARLRFEADAAAWVGCDAEQGGCLEQFVGRFVRLAYRRPIEDEERDAIVALAEEAADPAQGAWGPFSVVVEVVLQSPHFVLVLEPSADEEAVLPLDGHRIATRLALSLWDQAPDAALLDVADALEVPDSRATVIAEMLADPRSEVGLQRFAEAWFELESMQGAPFSEAPDAAAAATWRRDAIAEVRARLVQHVVHGDLRQVYTGRTATISPALADLYGLDVDADAEVLEVELDPASHRGGLLATAGFLAAHASGANPSTVRRGAYVRRVALCSEPPPPPPDVEMEDMPNEDHAQQPACWGCHEMLDPIGWGLDRYGPSGELREAHPDGTPVRDDGYLVEVEDSAFGDGVELGEAVIASPTFARCAVSKTTTWILGRAVGKAGQCLVGELTPGFENDHRVADLFGAVLSSDLIAARQMPSPEDTLDD